MFFKIVYDNFIVVYSVVELSIWLMQTCTSSEGGSSALIRLNLDHYLGLYRVNEPVQHIVHFFHLYMVHPITRLTYSTLNSTVVVALLIFLTDY